MGLDLSVHLGIQFVDLDQEVEKATKQSIRELFKEKGEGHFRQLEKFHLEAVIQNLDEFVLATGGGTPCFFDNLELMKKHGSIIYIDTPIDLINNRLEKDTTRPLMKLKTLEELLAERKGWYNQADHTIQVYKELLTLF